MSTKTIEELIHAKADRELEARVSAAFYGVYQFLSSRDRDWKIETPSGTVEWFQAYEGLKRAAFDTHRDSSRQQAVNSFLSNVESFAAQLQSLQENQRT